MSGKFTHTRNTLVVTSLIMLLVLGCTTQTRTNRLGSETSPYLLQHAENPVHWQPWGDEIWEMAQAEDKLVLISIGYASCHWCHVMEAETFENDTVAELMNERFINVKVDREERPDVDQVYMTAVQLMTGSGGWPLNVLVLPDGKPLYGGTYHSREQWMGVLKEVDSLYRQDPEGAREYAGRVAQGVAQANLVEQPTSGNTMDPALINSAVGLWSNSWDPVWGGNTGQQKFMMPPSLNFLMDFAYLSGEQEAKDHLRNSLDRMARGGVYDQIGGGFYRYSTDARWHIPHFEKMLYDNAQLMGTYARAYKMFGNPEYRQVVEEIFSFLRREMRGESGGYFSAMDADSEAEEGKYYLWTSEELQTILGAEYDLFAEYYQVAPQHAWENETYVLHREISDMEFLEGHNLNPAEFAKASAAWKKTLLSARSDRVAPQIDTKIITSWNALLVLGLADAYAAFGEQEYLAEARNLYNFLRVNLQYEGKIAHSMSQGVVQKDSFLEDYAFMGKAAFRLFQLTGDSSYFEDAEGYLRQIRSRFEEPDTPLFRFTEETNLMAPIYKTDDGVIPAPNTIIAELMLEIGHFQYDTSLIERSSEMGRLLQARFLQAPQNHSGWGRLLLKFTYPYFEVAVVGPDAGNAMAELQKEFLPNALIVFSETESSLPLFEMRYDPNATRMYVCQNHSCKLPVESPQEAVQQLRTGSDREVKALWP
jgi:uncharacterized protein YyaL (SSP411 family)